MTTHTLENLNIFLVGGAVRDEQLGRAVTERDWLVVGSTQSEMMALGFQQVGKDFPVFLHPETKEEYALARTERKSGVGYTGFVCHASPDVTIEEDLIRRDLTINAMAKDSEGKIIDPYGGLNDLKSRVLRHVSPAFSEDPLRVLRVARFAARYAEYGFSVAPETIALMETMVKSDELEALSAERVWKEFSRALLENSPQVFIETLRECGALKAIWPSLDKLWGIPNPALHHPEIDSGIHTMMVLQQARRLSSDIKVVFSALCHDLGKGLSPKAKLPSHHGHEKAGVPLVKEICRKLKVPNEIKQLALLVCEYHLLCHTAKQLRASTLQKLFNAIDIWRKPELLNDFLLCCEADARGRLGFEDIDYPQAEYIKEAASAALAVNAKTYIEQGLKGAEIKEAINNGRLEAIQQIKDKWNN